MPLLNRKRKKGKGRQKENESVLFFLQPLYVATRENTREAWTSSWNINPRCETQKWWRLASKSQQPRIISAGKEIHHNERFKVNHATHAAVSLSPSLSRPKPDHHHPNSNMPPLRSAFFHTRRGSQRAHTRATRRLVNARSGWHCVRERARGCTKSVASRVAGVLVT